VKSRRCAKIWRLLQRFGADVARLERGRDQDGHADDVPRGPLRYHRFMVILVAVLFGAAALVHTAPFPFLLEAFRPSRSLWHVPAKPNIPPTLYLTFDDGPNPEWTPALLDALAETGVHATFFLIDDHITPQTVDIVKRIASDGHAIALHTGRRWLMLTSPDALAMQMKAAAGRIHAITGSEPCHLFRPHGGWRSAAMYAGLEKAGFTLAGWSWGMWDWDWWRKPAGEHVAERLARKASAGHIIVIHDGHHKNPRADRRHAAAAVRLLVPRLKSRGFAFSTLCDAVSTR
jgi:peptidoglycan/xylan/chitin deacetylase (PgdA/CDA1 family)